MLDTHTFLWWVFNQPQLSAIARAAISDPANEILFSSASGWEIATKARLGRLTLPAEPEQFVPSQVSINRFLPLPITLAHALHVFRLPDLHKDPFDRLLIAQAVMEDVTLLTSDRDIARYRVRVAW